MKIDEGTTLGQLQIELVRLGVSSVHVGLNNGQPAERVALYAHHVVPVEASPTAGIVAVRGTDLASAFERLRVEVEEALGEAIASNANLEQRTSP